MQKGSPSPGTTKDAPAKKQNTSVSVAITEDNPSTPGLTPEEDPQSPLAIRKQKYNTRWKQQRNRAVRQHFSLVNILILYLAIGVIFMVFGVICFLYACSYPKALVQDYTHCLAKTYTSLLNEPKPKNGECFHGHRNRVGVHPLNMSKTIFCSCEVKFRVDKSDLWGAEKLILYFELSYFHQNIRRYKKDVDWDQLAGRAVVNGKAAYTHCHYPYYNATDAKYIFPCGKVANSYFSDSFQLFNGKGDQVQLKEEGISWESNKHSFENPKSTDLSENESLLDVPKDWHDGLKLDFLSKSQETAYGRGVENEHFIVWMRPAALNNFRKNYAFVPPLEVGEYTMLIQYRYEVKSYKGTKKFIIAADYKDRPKDLFFFKVYITVSVFCLLIGPLLFGVNWFLRKMDKRKSHSAQSGSSGSDAQHTSTSTDTDAVSASATSSAQQLTTTDALQNTSSEHPSTSGGSTKSRFGMFNR